jgi:hypothetical protein
MLKIKRNHLERRHPAGSSISVPAPKNKHNPNQAIGRINTGRFWRLAARQPPLALTALGANVDSIYSIGQIR